MDQFYLKCCKSLLDVKQINACRYSLWTAWRNAIKGVYFCQIEVISGLTDKRQFQYLTGLRKGPKCGLTYKFFSLTKINTNILSENTYTLHGTTLLPPVRRS